MDIVIPPSDVKFSEETLSGEVSRERSDVWEGINVSDCPGVQCSVVLDRSEGAVLLLNKKEGGCIGRF